MDDNKYLMSSKLNPYMSIIIYYNVFIYFLGIELFITEFNVKNMFNNCVKYKYISDVHNIAIIIIILYLTKVCIMLKI